MAVSIENLRVDRTSFFVGSTSSGKSSPFLVSTSKGKLFGLSFSSHSVCKINSTVNHESSMLCAQGFVEGNLCLKYLPL